MSLKNKVAIVTGGSSGIGAAIAEKFIECGAFVSVVGRNKTKLSNVEQKLRQKGGDPLIITADITNEHDVKRIVEETLNRFGKLDILVNNAGVGKYGGFLDNNAMEVFDNVMATNLRSVVLLTHLAAPHLIATKGNIVNISAVASVSILENSFAYCVSKAAMDHFTRCIARELAPKGVRVNNINPGPVKTDFVENAGLDDKAREVAWQHILKTVPLERVGDVEEIADLTEFVASDKARSITGSTIVSDNGYQLKN